MEAIHILETTLAISAGLLLAFVARRWFKLDNGALLVATVFAPAVIYLGVSGQLVEFKGFGLEAKFRAIAQATVTPSSPIKATSPSASEVESKSDVRAYFGIGSEVVVLRAPEVDKGATAEDVVAVAMKLYPGLLDGRLEAFVVVDQMDRVLGYFGKTYFYELLRIDFQSSQNSSDPESDRRRISQQLEHTQLWNLVGFPRLRAEQEGKKLVLINSISNSEALYRLSSAGQDVGVVVDHSGRYAGLLVTRRLTESLISALVWPTAKIHE